MDNFVQAFTMGFILPFIAASFGFAIAIVRNLLHKIDNDHL